MGASSIGALGGIRTPNLLIRSQVLYPLSYERRRAAIDVQVANARTTGYRVSAWMSSALESVRESGRCGKKRRVTSR
jgi:hypothetical protein